MGSDNLHLESALRGIEKQLKETNSLLEKLANPPIVLRGDLLDSPDEVDTKAGELVGYEKRCRLGTHDNKVFVTHKVMDRQDIEIVFKCKVCGEQGSVNYGG